MAIGFWVVQGDKTTCGGSVLTGHPKGKQIGPNLNRQATVGCQVSCGKHPGIFSVLVDTLENIFMAVSRQYDLQPFDLPVQGFFHCHPYFYETRPLPGTSESYLCTSGNKSRI